MDVSVPVIIDFIGVNTLMRMRDLIDIVESSDASIDDAVKALKKNPATAPLFKRGADDTELDRESFYRAVKSIMLDNHNVRAFLVQNNIVFWFDEVMKPNALDGRDVTARMVQGVKDFVKLVSMRNRSAISTDTRKQLLAWVNTPRGRPQLSRDVIRELENTPGIRPSEPLVLYRGFLFNDFHFDSMFRKETAPTVRAIEAAVQAGEKTFQVPHTAPSSWTTDPGTAEKFARFKAAGTQGQAMSAWLHRAKEEREIDGRLGVVISMLVRPEDILVDLSRVDLKGHAQHGDESEMILKPMENRTMRIVKAWHEKGQYGVGQPDEVLAEKVTQTTIASGWYNMGRSVDVDLTVWENSTRREFEAAIHATPVMHGDPTFRGLARRGQVMVWAADLATHDAVAKAFGWAETSEDVRRSCCQFQVWASHWAEGGVSPIKLSYATNPHLLETTPVRRWNVHVVNGGAWMADEDQSIVNESAALPKPFRVEYPFGLPGDGFRIFAEGTMKATCVAYYRGVDPELLRHFTRGNELRHDIDELVQSMRQHGFKGGDGQRIMVYVYNDPVIAEGNHRLAAALIVGCPVEVEFRYIGNADMKRLAWPFDPNDPSIPVIADD